MPKRANRAKVQRHVNQAVAGGYHDDSLVADEHGNDYALVSVVEGVRGADHIVLASTPEGRLCLCVADGSESMLTGYTEIDFMDLMTWVKTISPTGINPDMLAISFSGLADARRGGTNA